MYAWLQCQVHSHSDGLEIRPWTGWPRLVLPDQREAVGVAAGPGEAVGVDVGPTRSCGRGCDGWRDTIP